VLPRRLDVKRACIFDRCAPKDGIAPFDQLIDQFMSTNPYSDAQRVFVIVDNRSAHRGQRSIDRLQGTWPRGTTSARCRCGSFSDAALPNPA